MMETLGHLQKKEWKAGIDDHWIRTGCRDLWDALMIAFREYRDASPSVQADLIRERTRLVFTPTVEWVNKFYEKMRELSLDRQDTGLQQFFTLLPIKLISSEMVPYLTKYLEENPEMTMEALHREVVDKCFLLAEYRNKKKQLVASEELRSLVEDILTRVFRSTRQFSYDDVQQAMMNMEHQLIILSPQEKVLFDSKTWKDGMEGGEYQDVLIVLEHPDGSYDSIGRYSYTKDGHQKLSRLFHYDDEAVEALRSR